MNSQNQNYERKNKSKQSNQNTKNLIWFEVSPTSTGKSNLHYMMFTTTNLGSHKSLKATKNISLKKKK